MEYHIRFSRDENCLYLLDQRKLPQLEDFFVCRSTDDIVNALKTMVVRGAPAIGVTAAWGCVLAASELQNYDKNAPVTWQNALDKNLDDIAAARPTAINLSWAVERMRSLWKNSGSAGIGNVLTMWKAEANRIQSDDIATNKKMGGYGAEIIADGDCIMTHCNAGALATAGFGTALGVIYAAKDAGKNISVIANETRPFLQGARLSAYELLMHAIPVTVACDNACALLMKKGLVQKVVVGADRIAANGDVANKIGTYGVALLAKAHNIPFYVAAPTSTIDADCVSGDYIPIEQRPAREVTHIGNTCITPAGVPVYNFAFDVTPADLIAGIITEKGILQAPYKDSIAAALA